MTQTNMQETYDQLIINLCQKRKIRNYEKSDIEINTHTQKKSKNY